MGIFFDNPSVPLQLPGQSVGAQTGFVENTVAAYEAQMLARNSESRFVNLTDAYQPIVDALNEDRPFFEKLANPIAKGFDRPGILSNPLNLRSFKSTAELEDIIWTELDRVREADHNVFPDLPQNRDDLVTGVRNQVLAALQEEKNVAAAADTPGIIGQFVGAAGASITDPPNLLAMLVGAGEVGILRTIAVEALVGGAVEVPTQLAVADYYKELGIQYGPEDFITNVAAGAGGGAAFAAGVRLSAKGIAKTWDAVNKMTNGRLKTVIDVAGVDNSQVDDVVRASDMADTVDTENPLKEETFSSQTYRDVIGDAEETIEAGAVSDLGFSPMTPQKPLDISDIDGRIPLMRPGDLLLDPKTFQFKAAADLPGGVSRRLEGIEQWDPVRAGELLVWEALDGRNFVADGHQRVALANRIMAGDADADIQIPSHVLREADGITAGDARVVAATKNIAQGTGTAVDAAKILRVDPAQLRGLPQTSALVRMSRELTELSPDAFGMVVNEIVPANFAAIVGRLAAGDPDIHAAALGILAQAMPRNISEAEKIIRDIIAAGVRSETQLGLFGAEDVTVSLFRDRAKILDLATKRLRNDSRVFGTLINDAENIETAGNKLSAENNLQRKQQNVKALETLQALAHRKGAISDALSAASRQHADGGTLSSSVDQFVDSIRRQVELGDFEGFTTRPGGSISEPTSRDPASPGTRIANELEELKKWDDPEGQAVVDEVDRLVEDLADDADNFTLTDVVEDAEGNFVVETGKVGDVLDEIKKDKEFIEQLEICS
ncbi:MAG: hypothetical protein V3T82_07905 [Nitrospinaceae bacterium]